MSAWYSGNAACLTPLHTLKPSVLHPSSTPSSYLWFSAMSWLLSSLWIYYLCWFTRGLCEIWSRIHMYQATHIKTARPASLIQKNMKEKQKQKRVIRWILTVFEVQDQRSRFLSLFLALTCLKSSESVRLQSLHCPKVMARVSKWTGLTM